MTRRVRCRLVRCALLPAVWLLAACGGQYVIEPGDDYTYEQARQAVLEFELWKIREAERRSSEGNLGEFRRKLVVNDVYFTDVWVAGVKDLGGYRTRWTYELRPIRWDSLREARVNMVNPVIGPMVTPFLFFVVCPNAGREIHVVTRGEPSFNVGLLSGEQLATMDERGVPLAASVQASPGRYVPWRVDLAFWKQIFPFYFYYDWPESPGRATRFARGLQYMIEHAHRDDGAIRGQTIRLKQ